MPNPNALVDRVREVAPSAEVFETARLSAVRPATTVQFGGGRSGLLDMAMPRSAVWAEVLHSQREADRPVYVEIDPATHYITQLLCPLTVRVGAMLPADDGVLVELIISHSHHHLRRGNPHYQEMLETLQAARKSGDVLHVTETLENQTILDVRPAVEPRGRPNKPTRKVMV